MTPSSSVFTYIGENIIDYGQMCLQVKQQNHRPRQDKLIFQTSCLSLLDLALHCPGEGDLACLLNGELE